MKTVNHKFEFFLCILRALESLWQPINQKQPFMQNKANSPDAQMNINTVLTKDYERNDIFAVPENKANSNPKQTQNKAKTKPKQSQNKPNFTRRSISEGGLVSPKADSKGQVFIESSSIKATGRKIRTGPKPNY